MEASWSFDYPAQDLGIDGSAGLTGVIEQLHIPNLTDKDLGGFQVNFFWRATIIRPKLCVVAVGSQSPD